jgi:hypothetical protein
VCKEKDTKGQKAIITIIKRDSEEIQLVAQFECILKYKIKPSANQKISTCNNSLLFIALLDGK